MKLPIVSRRELTRCQEALRACNRELQECIQSMFRIAQEGEKKRLEDLSHVYTLLIEERKGAPWNFGGLEFIAKKTGAGL